MLASLLFMALPAIAGNPPPADLHLLWVADATGAFAVDPVDGEVLRDIAAAKHSQAIAIDRIGNVIWLLSKPDALTAFNLAGEPLLSTDLPASAGGDADMVVDATAGVLWLRAKHSLYRFDSAGVMQQEIAFHPSAQLRALALDEARSRLWLATRDSLLAFAPDGTQTLDIAVSGIAPTGIDAVAFDPVSESLWLVADRRVQRYDADGNRVFDGTAPRKLERADADGQGGLWAASASALYHLDSDGQVDLAVQPPAKTHGLPRALQADRRDGSVWVLRTDRLHHYARDGSLLHTLAPGSDARWKPPLSGLAMAGDPPVRVAIIAPAEGSTTRLNPPPVDFTIDGLRAVPARLYLAVNGSDTAVTCDALGDDVWRCTPFSVLSQGENSVVAAVGNDDGARFESPAVHFSIDSIPPVIDIEHPPEGKITNIAQTELRGSVSEPAALALNGTPVALAADLAFSQLIALNEGANTLALSAQDAAGNTGTAQRTVLRDSVPPAAPDTTRIVVASAAGGQMQVNVSAGAVEAGGSVIITNQTTGDSVIVIANADGSFAATLAGSTADTFVILARDAAGNASPAVPVAAAPPVGETIPPDPLSVAPALPTVGAPPLAERIAFLYTGSNPIQRDVAPGTIEARRVAVLRGSVRDRAGAPISGVTVSVLRHPELGHTLTRADGMFDLAVNGGGLMTLVYQKDGLLPAQRNVQTQWNDWFVADDVVMIPLDPQVTRIDLTDSSQPFQVAQGSVVEDSDGRRQVSLLFPAGTTATITRADGSTAQLGTLDVRATEYTVGGSGPDAMPAPLPPTSAYTYAVELSVDQARAQGIKVDGKDVVFNQPVPFYLDNFLDFPVGAAVPVGYYNADIAAWVPYPNGRIVKILSEENGQAVLDVAGNGQPASTDQLTALGISGAELAQLAATYGPGISLWRVPLTHFSTWDHNWPYGPPQDAEPPKVDPPKKDDPPDSDEENECPGCVISPQVRSLGESIPIAGTPYSLHYQSERAPGFGRNTVTIPLTGGSVPASLQTVELTISIAGQRETQRFAAAPNLSHTFEWDGLDGMGRPVTGSATAFIKLTYIYPCEYRPGDNGFAQFGDSANPIGTRDRCQGFEIPRTSVVTLQSPSKQSEAVANWGLSVENVLGDDGRMLRLGTGARRSLLGGIIETVAGSGTSGTNEEGVPATQARLTQTTGVAVGTDGSLYIADFGNQRIRRVTPGGIINTVAGTGVQGFFGDGGSAIQARLNDPVGAAVGADGSLYIADRDNNRIRRVTPGGIINTVAGTGVQGFSGDGGSAMQARLNAPGGVAIGADGSLYIADKGNYRVRRVTPGGIIDTVAGTGVQGFSGDGGPAAQARLAYPSGAALGADGSLYIADVGNNRIRRVTPDGIIDTVAGTGVQGFSGDGGPAAQARLNAPVRVALDAGGSLYIVDANNSRVRRIAPDGRIDTVAGNGSLGFSGDGGPATEAGLTFPRDVATGADGSVYIVDLIGTRIRRVTTGRQLTTNGNLAIPSEDGASRFVFDPAGRHLRTENTLTGQTALTFARDSEGRLLSVTDADCNVTTIERDGNGQPTAIIAPHGQRTVLRVDGNGHLAGVADPTGATWAMQYTDSGLMTGITHPNGGVNAFTYDADGRLLRDLDPEGGGWQIEHSENADGSDRTEMISGEGRVRVFSTTRQSNGSRLYTDQAPDGSITTRSYDDAGATTITQPDGTVLFTKEGPDPRFKMDAPVLAERKVTLPSGLAFAQTTTRAVTLADPADALSLQSLTDTVTTNGRVEMAAFDATASMWTYTSAASRTITRTVDGDSRPLTQAVTGLEPVTTMYDSHGRPNLVLQGGDSGARAVNFSYYDSSAGSQAGYLRAITDARGKQTAFVYDSIGRVTKKLLPDGNAVEYVYDIQGNLTIVTTPGRSVHVFDYGQRNQTTVYTPPDLSGVDTITRYHYNLDRQVTSIERPGGAVIDFAYDGGGRLASRTIPTGVDTYAYEATTGQLAAIDTSDGIGLAFTWDGLLPKSTTWSGPVRGRVSRSVDSNFWLTQETVEGDTVAFAYDADGLPVQAGDLSLARDPGNGLVTGVGLGIIDDARAYNGFGELADRNVMVAGAPAYQVDYTRDTLGRIVEQGETIGATTSTLAYVYDVAGRLTDVQRNGTMVERYTFDANSNRATKTTPTGTTTYSYDEQDRLLVASGTNGVTSYAYTAAGDLRSKTTAAGTTAYDYDAVGNLRAVVLPNNKTIAYLIDGQDRRIGKRIDGVLVQGLLYGDQLNPVAELNGAGQLVARFVYADQPNVPAYMVKNGVSYRIVSDHLGSVRLVIEAATGAVAQRMDYDAFGNVTLDTNPGFQPFGFAGGLYDRDTQSTQVKGHSKISQNNA
ncbi:MAG: hypothetical protein Q8L45_06260 [Xanthomonadaceae bacterium]|nr:hypothetical protein [Xanthomonadaceae bacterium]